MNRAIDAGFHWDVPHDPTVISAAVAAITQPIDGADTGDATPPSLTVPAPITLDATQPSGRAVTDPTLAAWLNSASAVDDTDPTPLLTNNAPAVFSAGTTTVTWVATDANGNVTTLQSTVTISCPAGLACTTISLTPPGPLTAEATDPIGSPRSNSDIAAWLSSASATDSAGVAVITNDAPPSFGFGTTLVTFTATDNSGHTATATAAVTVADTTPPLLTVPLSTGVGATSASGVATSAAAVQAFLDSATAYDAVAHSTSVVWGRCLGAAPDYCTVQDQPSVFPIGTWLIQFTTSDFFGNTSKGTAYLQIADVTVPSVTVPSPITVEATAIGGAPASLAAIQAFLSGASTSDAVDPSPVLSNDAPSLFALGTTTVHFQSRDASGNIATASATVTVVDTTAPTAAFSAPAVGANVGGSLVQITGTVGDLHFGRWALSVDGLANPFAGDTNPGSFSGTWDTLAGTLADGPHTLYLYVLDTQGNSRVVTRQVFVENDRTPFLQVTVHSPVHLWIVSPTGGQLGYNPANIPGGIVDTIVGGAYVNEDQSASPVVRESAYVSNPSTAGDYLIDVVGIGSGPYTVDITFATIGGGGHTVLTTVSYTGTASVGSFDTLVASYPSAAVRVVAVSPVLSYTGPTSGRAGSSITLSASLVATVDGTAFALAGRPVTLSFGGSDYLVYTDASGVASRSVTLGHVSGPGSNPVSVSFAGQGAELNAAAASAAINVVANTSSLVITAATPSYGSAGGTLAVVARLSNPDGTPAPGQACAAVVPEPSWCAIAFEIVDPANGDAVLASGTGALDASGVARANLGPLSFALGNYLLRAHFVASDDFLGSDASAPFALRAGGVLSASVPNLAFGSLAVGSTSSASVVTLTNSSTAAATVDTVSFTGGNASDFHETDNCTGVVLNPGDTCQITLTFQPSARGGRTTTLTVDYGGAPLTIALQGTGYTVPTVASTAPSSGLPTGGTSVVIIGTHLGDVIAVYFGSTSASFTIDSETQLTAVAPAHAPGTVDVTVASASATSAVAAGGAFTYLPTADLGLTLSHSGSFTAGSTGVYTVTVANAGPSAATHVTVTLTLPAGVSFGSATGASCVANICSLGTVASGGSASFTFTVEVASTSSGVVTTSAAVASNISDPSVGDNNVSDPTTVVVSADLSITLGHAGAFTAGSTGTYTVHVSNAGPSTATNVRVTLTLPPGMTYLSSSGATCAVSGSSVTCLVATSLASGAGRTFSARVAVLQTLLGMWTASADTTSDVGDPNVSDNSAIDPTTVVSSANVRIVLTHNGSLTAGANGSYLITVTNFGPSTATNLVATLMLGDGLSLLSSSVATCTASGGAVRCLIGALSSGTSKAMTVTFVVDPSLASASVTSLASVSSDTPDPDGTNNRSTLTSPVVVNANLKIKMAHSGSFVAGRSGVYALMASNAGPSNAVNVVVIVTLAPGLTFVFATGVSCRSTTGTITCTVGGLRTGRSVPFTVTVAVDPALTGTVTPLASITSSSPDASMANNTVSNATLVVAQADLVTTLSHVGPFVPGNAGSYAMSVMNNGPSVATGVVVSLTLAASLTVGLAPSGCSVSGSQLTCVVSRLASGARVSFSVSVQIAANAPASLTSTAQATSGANDPAATNNRASDTVVTTPRADLSVALAHTGSFAAGTSARYTITIVNTGPSNASAVVVLLTLPTGLVFSSATGATCTASGAAVTCTLTGSRAAGTSAVITVTVAVAASLLGTVTPTVSVTSATSDPNSGNNSASNPTLVVASADVKVTMTHSGSFTSGTRGSYVMSVSNAGPATAPNVVVRITLPAGMSFVSARGATCTAAGSVVTCAFGSLAPRGSVPFTLTVAVARGVSGTLTPTARVSSSAPDPNPVNNTVTNPTTVR